MSKVRWKLTDAQWQKIEPLLPKPKPSKRGGRPWADNRKVFEGILWILRTGAPWADLPRHFPSPSTCWRRLRDWEEQDIWLDAWRAFLAQLDKQGQKERKYQDGRKLRRYKRRYKVERTFSWLGNYRRLVVRWDHDFTVYKAFFHIACLVITLKRL